MKFAPEDGQGSANGLASLAIVKMLLDIMQRKELLCEEEVDIILNCASVEVNDADDYRHMIQAKGVIANMFQDADYRVATGPRELC